MKINIFLLAYAVSACILHAQIGINTENPKHILHIDGASSAATTNPASGSISTVQAKDDVVVTADGNMGFGTLSPTAKVHISTTNSTTPAMKIVDGTQGSEKILRSDANGNTSWIKQSKSIVSIHNILGGATYPNNVVSLIKTIPITETGNYLVIIRWWGMITSAAGSANNEVSAYFYLDESPNTTSARGTLKDGIEYYTIGMTSAALCLTTSLFAPATAGNYLKIFIQPYVGGDWIIGAPIPANPIFNPSIILFKI